MKFPVQKINKILLKALPSKNVISAHNVLELIFLSTEKFQLKFLLNIIGEYIVSITSVRSVYVESCKKLEQTELIKKSKSPIPENFCIHKLIFQTAIFACTNFSKLADCSFSLFLSVPVFRYFSADLNYPDKTNKT